MATENPDPGSPEWWLTRLSRKLDERRDRLTLYDDYYRGQHKLAYATKKFREAFGTLFSTYAENVCGLVVDALNERLHIVGFRSGPDGDRTADRETWDIWQRNQMDAWQTVAHRLAFVKEQSYLSVWAGVDGEPVIRVEDPHQMIVAGAPGDPRQRLAALKRWFDEDEGRWFATVYLPNGLYKYQTARTTSRMYGTTSAIPRGSTWEPRAVPDEAWPLANPLGLVPVVPLVNLPDLNLNGMCEIANVIPINNAINKLVSDLLLAAEFAAFRQKYAVNVELVEDDQGKVIEPWQVAVDKLMTAPPPKPGEPETKFGEFGATDLAPYVKAIEQRLQMVATVTRTPPHYLLGSMGNFPSGESLKATETGLAAKARERMLFLGEGHEEAMRIAWLVKGDTARAEALDSEAIWRDPESRTESQHIDGLVKLKTLGVPIAQLWEDAGYSPQQITRFKKMLREQARELGEAFDPFAPPEPPPTEADPQPPTPAAAS